MKKSIISLMLLLVLFSSAFASESKRRDLRNGSVSAVSRDEMNGAFYSATLHFASKESLYLADYTADKKFFYITDGEEAYLIPNAKNTSLYWKYEIAVSKLSELINEDIEYTMCLINELNTPVKVARR